MADILFPGIFTRVIRVERELFVWNEDDNIQGEILKRRKTSTVRYHFWRAVTTDGHLEENQTGENRWNGTHNIRYPISSVAIWRPLFKVLQRLWVLPYPRKKGRYWLNSIDWISLERRSREIRSARIFRNLLGSTCTYFPINFNCRLNIWEII